MSLIPIHTIFGPIKKSLEYYDCVKKNYPQPSHFYHYKGVGMKYLLQYVDSEFNE